ncbi:MAG TPA: hypothetical protein VGS98_17145 [Thermoanaerobaculia bacterium]|nr:hypothetical protein [Thermoanaerobaculia bacterium]
MAGRRERIVRRDDLFRADFGIWSEKRVMVRGGAGRDDRREGKTAAQAADH